VRGDKRGLDHLSRFPRRRNMRVRKKAFLTIQMILMLEYSRQIGNMLSSLIPSSCHKPAEAQSAKEDSTDLGMTAVYCALHREC